MYKPNRKVVLIMAINIQKWGNSQGIRIPKYVLDALNWSGTEQVEIIPNDDEIVIKKVNPAKERKTINELFAEFDGDYTPEAITWGEPAGKEVW